MLRPMLLQQHGLITLLTFPPLNFWPMLAHCHPCRSQMHPSHFSCDRHGAASRSILCPLL
jgi:hypothetical protein